VQHSKRAQESYLMIDHRSSPGLPAEMVRQSDLPPGARGGMFEAPTVTCSHCQRNIVINPLRSQDKPRAYCAKCDHYICDNCGVTMKLNGWICYPWKQLEDDLLNQAAKGLITHV
jgi:hypothetical protein